MSKNDADELYALFLEMAAGLAKAMLCSEAYQNDDDIERKAVAMAEKIMLYSYDSDLGKALKIIQENTLRAGC